MDCKAFAARHAAYIDDTLPGIEMVAMREHLSTCTRCSRRDADVRRALLLVKNLPAIEVSAGFNERLRSRIAAESAAPPPQNRTVSGSATIKWAAAAGLLVALIGIQRWDNGSQTAPSRLPAVVASIPAETTDADDESAPAYMASMSTGIPMWPALMLAEEGPLRFAATGMQNALDTSRPHD
jgi:anti-sigma factor RsiW